MEREELLKRIRDLKRNDGGEVTIMGNEHVIVKSCDFTNIALSTIECMDNVMFIDCKLINTGFSHIINECSFVDCDLTGSLFINCEMHDIIFLKSIGSSASFDNCYFRNVVFCDVNMNGVDIIIKDIDDDDFISLGIESSVINDLVIRNVNAESCISIKYSHLRDMTIANSYLGDEFIVCGSRLDGLSIEDTNVCSSIIRDSEMPHMYVKSEYFSPMCNNVNFMASKLTCWEIDGAKFVDCNMSRIEFDCDDIKNVCFRNSALTNALMSDCHMHNVDFISCKFLYMNIRGSHFHDCNFSGCVMGNVKLSYTEFTRISEFDPNYIELCTNIGVDSIKWDGLEIANIEDTYVAFNKPATLKQQIIHEIRRRKNA